MWLLFGAPVFVGSHPRLFLEELVEGRNGLEVEPVAYLLDGQLRINQQIFRLKQQKGVYPFCGSLSACVLDQS